MDRRFIDTINLAQSGMPSLNKDAVWTALKFMLVYTAFVVIYNTVFDQNLLDLRYPTMDIEQLFGEWPIYVGVNILLTLFWYYLIHLIPIYFRIIKFL